MSSNVKSKQNHIPGEAGVWIFIFGDMLVFSLFFLLFLFYRNEDVQLFNQSAAQLNVHFGAGNTIVLLCSSLFMVIALHAYRAKKILTEKIDDLHKIAKALLIYETLSGDEIKDLILRNNQPQRKDEKEDKNSEESSALGSLGLKPKPVH